MQGEVWKDIPGYEGLYQASNMGRVRSLPRVVDRGRWGSSCIRGRTLKPGSNKGYQFVILRRNGKSETRFIHRLVAETFIGPLPEGLCTRHMDGNPGNNAVSNLEYGTGSENQLDLYQYRGYHHRLHPAEVLEIRSKLASGERAVDIAKDYGVSRSLISEIKAGRCYRWLR